MTLFYLSNQTEAGLEQLTQGLAGLDISQARVGNPVTSTPVGGARPKVRHSLENPHPDREVGAESGGVTAALNQSVERTKVSKKKQKTQHNQESAVVFVSATRGGGGLLLLLQPSNIFLYFFYYLSRYCTLAVLHSLL